MNEYDWKCNICSAIFSSFHSVWTHYNSEHVQSKYICMICADEFREKSSFNVHWDHEHKHKNTYNVNTYERKIELVSSNHEFVYSFLLFPLNSKTACIRVRIKIEVNSICFLLTVRFVN